MNTYQIIHRKGSKVTEHSVVRKADATDMAYCLVAKNKGSSATIKRTTGVMTWGIRRGLRSITFSWKGKFIVTACTKPRAQHKAQAPNYTHVDNMGMGWRFSGMRPVSALADQVMRDCGLPLR